MAAACGQARAAEDNDRNTYVVVVIKDDLESARQALIEEASRSVRSAGARTTSSCGSTTPTATAWS